MQCPHTQLSHFVTSDWSLVQPRVSLSYTIHDNCFSPASEVIQPSKATPLSSAGAIRQLLANPEDIPELVAVRCDFDGSSDVSEVGLLDVNEVDISGGWRSGETQGTTPASSTFIDISPTERSILTYHSTKCPGLPKANNSQSGYNWEISLHLLLQVLQRPSRLYRRPLTRTPSRSHPSLGSPIPYPLLSVSLQTN